MAVNVFGLTHTSISDELADFPAFDTVSTPTATQVTTKIQDIAGEVAAHFRAQSLSASSLAGDDDYNAALQRIIKAGVCHWVCMILRGPTDDRTEYYDRLYRERLKMIDVKPQVLGRERYHQHNVEDPEAGTLVEYPLGDLSDKEFF